ncbi:cation-translocating P-type ATPase [Pseudoflavonifractor phocaeensis]|uniref:cation-translocating P-type ATPase n=1 Tax=Pseudoflavonifractor phocaeensis TaxID=1870988 RepID=UPI001957C39D|nr:cation-translocating P-type ATPase [Pseudoflavonifractor phocaeensis]MBM6887837.1 cation-translocating P-type ATPase [Pseudoflavonifractor phocaeensis]
MDRHRQTPWHARKLTEIYETLHTSEEGLGDAEAAERLKKYGRNELRSKPPKTILQMLKAQIIDPMVLILIGAAAFSAILQEWTEAAVIFIIVIVNAVIGIVQEKKAQSSLEALRNMSAPTARVLRQGEESVIPASELVVGDVVMLGDGDMVPADLRLIDSANLKVQEASLTGESVPSEKEAEDILPEDCPLGDRSNMAYTSAIVTYGRATGVVVATGMDTEVGNIAGMLDNQDDTDTPLKRKLNAVGKTLTIVGLIVCALIFAIGAFYQRPLIPQFLVAISLAISIIPEGLPATATIVMALGVQHMAKKNALIRKLPAVETLGGATVICSDKTGTLTLNKMTVTHIAVNGDFENGTTTPIGNAAKQHPAVYRELVYAAALCNDASLDPDRKGEIIGDPTEGALIYMAQAFGIDHEALEDEYPRFFEQPFDSERKRMTTVHRIHEKWVSYTKGAVDEMLPLCTHILTSEGVRPITEADKENITKLCLSMSEGALRVLGFAMRTLMELPTDDDENVEFDMTFVGVTGMIDPPRKEVADSVRTCRQAGIRTIMITGDHKVTALAIAKELDIYREGNTVVSGEELDTMTDDELDDAVKTTTVFARVSPADKLRIIQSLKRTGEVAAMTGDGVNDSPALKAADIGVAMGITGTDVAKDAADMILLDDSFTTIAYAIKEGRRVYRNIQKVIQFLLVGNIAEILTLFVATLFNWDAPLLAVHILWVNLATATLPALALGVDPASKNIMKHKPVKSGTLFEKDLVRRVIIQGIFVAAMTTCAYWIGASMGSHVTGQTMAFCVLAFSQMLRAFNQRSNTEPIWVRAEGINPWLIVSFVVSALLMACILLVPALQNAFRLTLLDGTQWLIVIGLSLMSILQVEIVKTIKKHIHK